MSSMHDDDFEDIKNPKLKNSELDTLRAKYFALRGVNEALYGHYTKLFSEYYDAKIQLEAMHEVIESCNLILDAGSPANLRLVMEGARAQIASTVKAFLDYNKYKRG